MKKMDFIGKRNRFLTRIGILKQLFHFLWKERMWWMIPLVAVLLVFGLLIAAAQQSVLAPFVYTLF